MNEIVREYEDALFKLIVYEAVKEKSAEYMKEAIATDIDIPENTDVKVKKMICKEFRKRHLKSSGKIALKTARRIAIVAAIVISITFSVTMSVQALRENFTRFLLTFYSDSTRLELIQENSEKNRIESGQVLGMTQHAPTYIPEGFVVKSLTMTGNDIDIYYENPDGKFISFARYAGDSATHINSENADIINTVDISGMQGMLVVEDDTTTITWYTDDYYFVLFTYLSEDESLKIARSVKIIE